MILMIKWQQLRLLQPTVNYSINVKESRETISPDRAIEKSRLRRALFVSGVDARTPLAHPHQKQTRGLLAGQPWLKNFNPLLSCSGLESQNISIALGDGYGVFKMGRVTAIRCNYRPSVRAFNGFFVPQDYNRLDGDNHARF